MVQALYKGIKTKTRRIAKAIPNHIDPTDIFNWSPEYMYSQCPYGQPGDILWVRENFRAIKQDFGTDRFEYKATEKINTLDKWRPSIHMPKEACRLFLKIKNIRVERLQDITQEDAIAEGIGSWVEERMKSKPVHYQIYWTEPGDESMYSSCPILSFESLWKSINGVQNWDANPWVWVIEFEKCDRPENFLPCS